MNSIKQILYKIAFLMVCVCVGNAFALEMEVIHKGMHKMTAPISLDYDIKEGYHGNYTVNLSIKSLANQQLEVEMGTMTNVEFLDSVVKNVNTSSVGKANLSYKIIYNGETGLNIPLSIKVLNASEAENVKYVRNFTLKVKNDSVSKAEKASAPIDKVVLPLERQ